MKIKSKMLTIITTSLLLATACNSNDTTSTSSTNIIDNNDVEGVDNMNEENIIDDESSDSNSIDTTNDIQDSESDNTNTVDSTNQVNNEQINNDLVSINNHTSIDVLVNKKYYLPQDYVPEDLVIPNVPFPFTEFNEKKQLRQVAATALEKLFNASKQQKLALFAVSGFRSYSRQKSIYENNLATKGEEYTNKYSAKPGHSEHQTGIAIDVSCASVNYSLDTEFESTPEGKWLVNNAHKYGFVIRYPKGKENITGYSYEPWHIRYVGLDIANYLFTNDLTLDQYYEVKNIQP